MPRARLPVLRQVREPMKGKDEAVTRFWTPASEAAHPFRDAHARAWISTEPTPKVIEAPWGGQIVLTPASENDPVADMCISFKPTPKSRSAAFEFARGMYEAAQERASGQCDVQFIAASDHYHVIIAKKGLRLATDLARNVTELANGIGHMGSSFSVVGGTRRGSS